MTERRVISIPHGWDPRPYQMPLWQYLQGGGKRAVAVWHRRAGKDSLALNWTAAEALEGRIGVYWHLLPTSRQARKVVWDGIDKQGRRVIDQVFPKEVRKGENATEMKIELVSGSMWQLAGSDNFDSLVGSNPVGVVFSEWPLTNPSAWDYVRPILAENGGWALFIYTPRGRNHGWRMFQTAQKLDHWFAQALTVDDTGVIPLDAIEEDRASGMAEELIEQEYYVSFDSALVGSYFGAEMKKLRKAGRVTSLPHEPELPVYTCWDIGVGDSTSIWWYQLVGRNVHWIDYYESSGAGIDHYVRKLREKEGERDFVYADHWAPHDIRVREWGTGRSRAEQAKKLGVRFRVAPNLSFEDGVNAVRAVLKRSVFDAVNCERGIDALETYRKEWDQDKGMFKERPVHDWSSHPTDALRYGAVSLRDRVEEPAPKWPEQMTLGQQLEAHFKKRRRARRAGAAW